MREIEVKARNANSDAIITTLQQQGVEIGEPVTQHDEVFNLSGVDGESNNNAPWLRIRTEQKDGKQTIIYTLKKSVSSQLDSIEHETVVADASELREIILHSGFEPYVDVTKTRRRAKIGDVEICIDEVEDLGEFIEAEKMTDESADAEVVCEELWKLLESFGVLRSDEVTEGYDTLMKAKLGLNQVSGVVNI